jgi:ERCC4-type nuclease
MIIKIDCREKELLALLAPAPASATAPAPAEPKDYYIMDLGDGMTMNVPYPKKSLGNVNATSKKRKPATSHPHHPSIATSHEIKSERLPLGDIILHGHGHDIVLFERKTLNDLAASIQDGRYKEQSFRLLEEAAANGFCHHNIVYIIEGNLTHYHESRNHNNRITKSALQSAMVSLLYYKGFSVVRTMNIDETADFILHFADKVEKEGPLEKEDTRGAYSEVAAKKEKRDYITRENIGEIMLAQVPGVSAKIASAILSKYNGSLYGFLADLQRKINDYEESLSPELSPPSPNSGHHSSVSELVIITEQTHNNPVASASMNKNKMKHVSECFADIAMDGKRGIGKATIEKLCYFLS